MKFIITESKMEQVVFNYLDNQDFIKVENKDIVYFLNSTDDKSTKIRYNKNYGWCNVNYILVKEISSFFSLDNPDSKNLIGKWVEYTLQMRVTNTRRWFFLNVSRS